MKKKARSPASSVVADLEGFETDLKLLLEDELTTLTLTEELTEVKLTQLVQILKSTKRLDDLCLLGHFTRIGTSGGVLLAAALRSNQSLLSLNVQNNNLGVEGTRQISLALRSNYTLTSLDLSGNRIKDRGAKYISDALKDNKSISSLSLGDNLIGPAGASYIGEALKMNNSLTKLDLFCNVLGNEGAKHIASGIMFNTSLEKLIILGCSLSVVGYRYFEKALQVNENLTSLICFGSGVRVVEPLIKKNREIKMKTFFETMSSEKAAPWNRSRLMFVGEGNAGKSATVRSLLGKPFNVDWESTIGAEVFESMIMNSEWNEFPDTDLDFSSRFAARILANTPKDDSLKLKNMKKENKIASNMPSTDGDSNSKSVVPESLPSTGTHQLDSDSTSDRTNTLPRSSRPQFSTKAYDRFKEVEMNATKLVNSMNLSIWDFGGQAVFYSMHQIFLTRNGVYMVVFDLSTLLVSKRKSKSLEYLSVWFNLINLYAPASPVIIVGTRSADVECSQDFLTVDSTLREAAKLIFSQLVVNVVDKLVYFPIDNKDNSGISLLRFAIENAIQTEASLEKDVPMKYMMFLDKMLLRGNDQDYLTYREASQIALNVGICSLAEQEAALRLFNERGALVYLSFTESLKNTIVLSPQWLLDALGKVIRDGNSLHAFDPEHFQKVGLEPDLKLTFEKALASRDFLEYVWDYEQVDFLIDLMKHVMLLSTWSFSEQTTYLIPCLIQDECDTDNMLPDSPKCVFDFSRSFLPTGFFQRLICLCIDHSARAKLKLPNTIKEPILYKDFGSIEFEDGMIFHLFEEKKMKRITFFADSNRQHAGGHLVIQAMLVKLNSDFMANGLYWETLLEDPVTGNMISQNEAKSLGISPWYDMRDSKEHVAVDNLNLKSFLDDL